MAINLYTKILNLPNFARVRFDFTKELNMAMDMVKKSIQDHIKGGKSITDDSPLVPLAPSTVNWKKNAKAGWSYAGSKLTGAQASKINANATHPLRGVDNLIYNQKITKATPSKQTVEMEIGPQREDIYWKYLHDGSQTAPARPVFGIGKEIDSEIDNMIEKSIDRMLAKL